MLVSGDKVLSDSVFIALLHEKLENNVQQMSIPTRYACFWSIDLIYTIEQYASSSNAYIGSEMFSYNISDEKCRMSGIDREMT